MLRPFGEMLLDNPANPLGRKGTLGGRSGQTTAQPLRRKGTLAKCTSELLAELGGIGTARRLPPHMRSLNAESLHSMLRSLLHMNLTNCEALAPANFHAPTLCKQTIADYNWHTTRRSCASYR